MRSNTSRLRTVFYRNPGQCFTTVCNENTAQIRCCIRYRITATKITTEYGSFSCRISSQMVVCGEVTAKNTVIRNPRPEYTMNNIGDVAI